MTHDGQLATFIKCLEEGSRRRCLNLIREWEQQKLPDDQLYHDIIIPALVHFGEGWESNQKGILEEHLATQTIKSILAYKAATLVPRRTLHRKVLVGCVPDEHHTIAAMIMANLLEEDGWDVMYYGASVPRYDLIEGAIKLKPDLVCLTMKTIGTLESTMQLCTELHEALPEVEIMIGGMATPSVQAILSECSDLVVEDLVQGVEAAAKLIKA